MNIQQSTLSIHPELYKEVIHLIEKEFHYNDSNSFEVDFAPLMEPLNHENNHILLNEGKVIGHIGVLHKTMSQTDSPIILLGGIAIDREYQGQGLFKDFFKNVIKKYKDKSALMILWSDLNELYEKFNFNQVGGVIQTGTTLIKDNDFISNNFTKTKLSNISDDELKEISLLYKKQIEDKNLSIKRSNRDWNSITQIISTDLYIHKNEDKIDSYFLAGKGQDLEEIIHECCISESSNISYKDLQNSSLWLPENFKDDVSIESLSYCGLLAIGEEKLFTELIKKWSNGAIQVTDTNHGFVCFTFKEIMYELDHSEFLSSVFGPNPVEEFEELGAALFICGVDSI